MFEGLLDTQLAGSYRLLLINLPGFGAPTLGSETTLDALAGFVADKAEKMGARIIVAHSVASIIASLAAAQPRCPITTIISLEGNITADDAYFSGTAADYDDPHTFRTAFLERLSTMATESPVIRRYHQSVSEADPLALWQLGTDARRFSSNYVPGDVLIEAARVVYLFNPENCPNRTLEWLEDSTMDRILLESATHWKSVDQPGMLAEKILRALLLLDDPLDEPSCTGG